MKGTLHHLEFYVSNLRKTIEFWSWLIVELGYKKYQEWDEGISYKLLDTYIVFVQTEKKYMDIKYHRKRTGLNHIAFHLTSQDMVDQFTKKLKERNVNILYKNSQNLIGNKDYCAIFFEDPDRIKVELVAPK